MVDEFHAMFSFFSEIFSVHNSIISEYDANRCLYIYINTYTYAYVYKMIQYYIYLVRWYLLILVAYFVGLSQGICSVNTWLRTKLGCSMFLFINITMKFRKCKWYPIKYPYEPPIKSHKIPLNPMKSLLRSIKKSCFWPCKAQVTSRLNHNSAPPRWRAATAGGWVAWRCFLFWLRPIEEFEPENHQKIGRLIWFVYWFPHIF